MEEGVYLVCEALGVSMSDAVTAADVGVLYEKVAHRPTSPCLTQNAISQVTGKKGGKSCSAGKVLQVLMEMEKERKRKEELYWDDQLLRAGQAAMSVPIASCCQHRQSKGKWCLCIWKLRVKAKQLSIRLALEGPWNVLPSLRYGNQVPQKQEWPQPSSITQIPLLLQRKYDIIRERLYVEMLHEGHGGVWWEGLSPEQREESVCELQALVERALSDHNMVALSHLPGAFRIYSHQVPREVSEERRKLREQFHLAVPQEQLRLAHPQELAWTALIFLMELESSYQEERRALHTLMTRLDQTELCDVCTSLRSAVTRAQKETASYTTLLTARQNWEKWPDVTTDVKAEHLTPLIQKRDQHQDTNNMLGGLDEYTQDRPAQPPSSTNADTSMDNGDQLLLEETPYLEILCQRSQPEDRQPKEPIEGKEEEGLEKQGSVIAAAWSDIVEPANGESASQSPLDQDQDLDSEEETSGEENLDLAPTQQHTPEDKPSTHTSPHTHSHTTADPQTEHSTHNSSEEQNTPADTQAPPRHSTQPSQHPEEDPREQKPSSDPTQCHAPENTANADARQQQKCLDANRGGEETLVRVEPPDEKAEEGGVCRVCIEQDSAPSGDEEAGECVCDVDAEGEVDMEETSCAQENVCVQDPQCVRVDGIDMPQEGGVCEDEVCVGEASVCGDAFVCEEREDVCAGGVCEKEESPAATGGGGLAAQEECVCGESVCVCVPALQREETMRSLVDMQRKLELRYQRERERHTLRIQERLTIIQNRKSEDDLLAITDLSTFTKEEDEQIQKVLVRERLEQLRRERSYILQTRRERNTAGFKELLGPTAQHTLRTED